MVGYVHVAHNDHACTFSLFSLHPMIRGAAVSGLPCKHDQVLLLLLLLHIRRGTFSFHANLCRCLHSWFTHTCWFYIDLHSASSHIHVHSSSRHAHKTCTLYGTFAYISFRAGVSGCVPLLPRSRGGWHERLWSVWRFLPSLRGQSPIPFWYTAGQSSSYSSRSIAAAVVRISRNVTCMYEIRCVCATVCGSGSI